MSCENAVYNIIIIILFDIWYIRGARVAQWWEHSPPTNVAWVQIPMLMPYVRVELVAGSPYAATGFSPDSPVLRSPQKPTFPNSNSTRNKVDEEPLSAYATISTKWLFIYCYLFYKQINITIE